MSSNLNNAPILGQRRVRTCKNETEQPQKPGALKRGRNQFDSDREFLTKASEEEAKTPASGPKLTEQVHQLKNNPAPLEIVTT